MQSAQDKKVGILGWWNKIYSSSGVNVTICIGGM